jgi:hypothetical protein
MINVQKIKTNLKNYKMKLQIIETPDYWLAVSTEEPVFPGYGYDETNQAIYKVIDPKILYKEGYTDFNYINRKKRKDKIIAYQPKNNTPELDLPLIPKMVVEDDFEIELKNFDSANILDILNMGNINYLSNGDIVYNPDLLFIKTGEKWFTKNKSATKVYSEEDLRKALFDFGDVLFNNCQNGILEEDLRKYENDILQSLKQPTPKWFVAEMEYFYHSSKEFYSDAGFVKCTKEQYESIKSEIPTCPLKTELKTTTINGKTYLVGKYLKE